VTGRPAEPPDPGLLGAVIAGIDTPARGPAGRPHARGPLSAAWPALRAAADWTADHWADADLTATRIDAWSGLDAMARLARVANPLDLDAVAWQQEGREILNCLESNSVASDGGLTGGGEKRADEPRADLLPVAWTGPWPATSPVVAATVDRALERLTASSLVYRWADPSDDSPDLEASLWAVRALAVLGRWDEAHERMDAVVALTGPTHLLAQAADPVAGELLGNLPSTAAGLAFINAALELRNGPR
jgi:GH15 family glucan-1,4-alpha-glucosidase